MKTYNVALDGKLIGDVTEVPSGWLAWDSTIDKYLWPKAKFVNTFPDRDSAVRELVNRHRAIQELEDLMTAIVLLGGTEEETEDERL